MNDRATGKTNLTGLSSRAERRGVEADEVLEVVMVGGSTRVPWCVNG